MQVLITGITGRVGAYLAQTLTDDGHQVRGLVWAGDPNTERLEELPIDLVEGDLTNVEDVRHAMKGIEIVCHLGAAFQAGGPFTHDDYFQINVGGILICWKLLPNKKFSIFSLPVLMLFTKSTQ